MSVREQLNAIAARRILILDGAMGSMIQALNPGDNSCNDLLCITKPEAIFSIHEAYLEAGADIIETNSFNSTSVSLSDFGLEGRAYEISAAAAALARKCADKFSSSAKPRFVAGSMGPMSKSGSLSPDVCDLSKRAIYWDELEAAYYDNARGLLDGGADILLVETIFDTLNAKAALFAISRLLEERSADVPVMISATVQGEPGRLLSGQTLEAFCISVLHANPWALGLNCSFGPEKLLPHLRRLSGIAPCMVSAHPNAGLPNQTGAYDETPQTMSEHIEAYFKEGLVNIVGGCCGSTPAHIAAIAEKAASHKPRKTPPPGGQALPSLAGLEPLAQVSNAAGINVAGIHAAAKLAEGNRICLSIVGEEDYEDASDLAQDMVEEGAAIVDFSMDGALPEAEKTMGKFLDTVLSNPYIAKVPFMLSSANWNVLEAGLKRLQGKGIVNSINLKDGEEEFLRRTALVRRYGAAAVVTLIDEKGEAETAGRKTEIAGRACKLLKESGFPAGDIVFADYDNSRLSLFTNSAGSLSFTPSTNNA